MTPEAPARLPPHVRPPWLGGRGKLPVFELEVSVLGPRWGLRLELLFEREAAGGDLSEEEESRYVALLDEVWWQLSASDQEQMERELMQVPVQVSEDPSLVDLAVTEGTNALPRRAA